MRYPIVSAAVIAGALAITSPQEAAPLIPCPTTSFQGVDYRGPQTLRTGYVAVGRRIGTATIPSCQDAHPVGEEPTDQQRAVYRLRNIPAALAVSVGGSSRIILIRAGACRQQRERALLRCLRHG